MKILSPLILAFVLGGTVLAGCSTPSPQRSDGMRGMSRSDGDMTAMCEMHKKMMGSMSADEQKKMMDTKMKDMSPEMRTKHMEAMSRCR